MIDEHTQNLLNHIHSLKLVSMPDQISHGDVKRLLDLGYIRQAWINTYALTEAGKRIRKGIRS